MSDYIIVDDGTTILVCRNLKWNGSIPLYNVVDMTETLTEALTIAINLKDEDDWAINGIEVTP